jgi:DNA primase
VYDTDKGDVEGRTAVARRGLELIEKVKNELKRSEYLRLFAEKLDMNERAMRAEFAKSLRRRRHETEQPESKLSEVEADLLKVLIERTDLREEARRNVSTSDLAPETFQQFIDLVFRVPTEEENVGQYLMECTTDPEVREVFAGVLMRQTSMESGEKAVADWIQSVSRSARQRRAEQLQKKIQNAERLGDTEAVMSLLKQKEELVS